MSSKFSMPVPRQRPPHICIKPPPGPEFSFPAFPQNTWQGHVDFYAPWSPYEGGFTSYYHILPDPPNLQWTVLTGTGPNQVQIMMEWWPATSLLDFTLKCYSDDVLYDTYTISGVVPRSWNPFDSGLLYPDPGPPGGHLRFRILA